MPLNLHRSMPRKHLIVKWASEPGKGRVVRRGRERQPPPAGSRSSDLNVAAQDSQGKAALATDNSFSKSLHYFRALLRALV